MDKIFAIGDIHGCLAKLERLVAIIDFDKGRDILLFIGDYIDRGPDSRGVVDYVLDLREKVRNVICLRGNHEQMLLNYLCHGRDRDLFLFNGGRATLSSYGFRDATDRKKIVLPDDHMEFFQSLLPWYETDDYIFVHAGLRPGIPLDKQSPEDLMWIRYEFIDSSHDFGRVVVFGHTHMAEPLMEANKIGIDTGAVYGGSLTCVALPEKEIYQA